MKTFLKILISLMLFGKIQPEGCGTSNGKIICENIDLKNGIPSEINRKEIWSIDFNFCSIPVVPTGVFRNFDNVTILWIDNSEVRVLEPGVFGGLSNLEAMHVENNALMEIQPGVFNSLERLTSINLNENHLLKIEKNCFRNLPHLKILRLENNNIKSISVNAFENLPSLEELFLRHNAIESFQENLQKLWMLDLAYNHLAHFDCDQLTSPELLVLHLDHNNLSSISNSCFNNLQSLSELRLNDNKLKEIDAKRVFRSTPNLSSVFLNKNPWKCHSLLNTVQVLYNADVMISDSNTTNSTNVYGVACKWNYEDFDETKIIVCNNSQIPTVDYVIRYESSTEMSETSEKISNFATSQIPNTLVCKNNCAMLKLYNFLLLVGLAVVFSLMSMIIFYLCYRNYRIKNSNCYKVKKHIALDAL